MPNPLWGPRGALATEVDATVWAGEDLFATASGTVTAPSTWTTFGDALDLLTGRGVGQVAAGSGKSIADLVTQAAAATGTAVTGGITTADRVSLVFSGATSVTLAPSANNAVYGFDVLGQTSVAAGGDQLLTAVGDWQRGTVDDAPITLTRGASSGSAPAEAFRAHGVVWMMRQWGSGDADDTAPTTNLQYVDTGASWGIGPDGRVWRARDVGDGDPITSWSSATFRAALGFAGDETETASGDLRVLTATHQCRWLLTPSRPWERVVRGHEWSGTAVRVSDGGAAYTSWLDLRTLEARGFIDGQAGRVDRQDHWLRSVLPYMPPGGRVTLYQDWGDGRRGARTADNQGYSDLYTDQQDGDYGRWLCRRSVDARTTTAIDWPSRMQRRAELTVVLSEQEGGQ